MATWGEALTVANSWIARIMETEGYWGGYDRAEVEYIQEFTRNGRVIGYFCRVNPVGFIVVSLRKELAPVKAYSAECNLDPESNEGMADLLKMKMEGLLDAIEQPIRLFGVDAGADVQGLLEIDYRPAWDKLCGEVKAFSGEFEFFQATDSVSQVGPLLSSSWHQGEPYNLLCPESDDCGHCSVGCVALAGAQIMRYWAWPPEGVGYPYNDTYDWLNMPDKAESSWSDDDARVKAVAELCYEIGDAVKMQYCLKGCDSGANIYDMNDAYGEYFHYHKYGILKRADYWEIWLDDIQGQLKANRPIHYRYVGHHLVLDGWREDGDTAMRQYHMNYGWGLNCDDPQGCNTWYSLDPLYDSDNPNEEKIIADVYPAPALSDDLIDNWTYPKEQFNYRYFDQDANGVNVTFAKGQNLQFLPRVKVECIGGSIEFRGESSNETRLFSIKGTATGGKVAEAWIYNGEIRLYQGGSIKFH